jgi:hypothetical protein
MESEKIIESPVRRPLQVPNDVFFFNRRNRERVNGLQTPLEIATPETVFNESVFAGGIVVALAALAYVALPHIVWLIIPITALLVWILPFLIVNQANGRLNHRLTRGGEFVVGKIVSCAGSLSGGRSPRFQVTTRYTFPAAGGIQLLGTSTQIRPTLEGKQLPVPGTPVVILYFSDSEHYLL